MNLEFGIKNKKNQTGFTLMEIVVATTIFAVVTVALLSLFNYILKINRRSQALTQAADGMRNFVEFLTKQIQNGQIDYYITTGSTYSHYINDDNTVPCGPPLDATHFVGSLIFSALPPISFGAVQERYDRTLERLWKS